MIHNPLRKLFVIVVLAFIGASVLTLATRNNRSESKPNCSVGQAYSNGGKPELFDSVWLTGDAGCDFVVCAVDGDMLKLDCYYVPCCKSCPTNFWVHASRLTRDGNLVEMDVDRAKQILRQWECAREDYGVRHPEWVEAPIESEDALRAAIADRETWPADAASPANRRWL